MRSSAPTPVTRFAPSPTGYLHLGHVASALYVFGLGRRLGAKVLLRLEDHDRSRFRSEYELAIFEDLRWLGLLYDNVDLQPGSPSPYRQSDSDAFYRETLARLAKSHQVYACECSRKQVAQDSATHGDTDLATSDEPRYGGRCRDLGLPLDRPGVGLRVVLPEDEIKFADLNLGPLVHVPARQCGDLLVRDRLGQWTYQFAVVADDLRQGVDLVIRGQDLTESTGRQILLGRMLGRTSDARFYHHPLIKDDSGKKLGKRVFSEAIAKRRAAGERAEDVLGDAAFRIGLLPRHQPIHSGDLAALFKDAPAPLALAEDVP